MSTVFLDASLPCFEQESRPDWTRREERKQPSAASAAGATGAPPQLNGVSVVPGIISRMTGGPASIGPWRHGDVTKDATRADGWQTCDTCGRGATTQAALNLEPCAPPVEDELAAD